MVADEPAPGPPGGGDLARAKLARATAVSRERTPAEGGRAPSRRRRGSASGASRGSRPDGRDPALVGDVLDRWLTESGWTDDMAIGGLTGRWPEIVGEKFADHVSPEFVETDGERVCLLRADSTAWATQVRLLVPQIHRRLAEVLGEGTVQRIKVVGPAPPTRSPGPRRVPGRGPRDTYG